MAAVTSSAFEREAAPAPPPARSLKSRCLHSIAWISGLTWLIVSVAIVGFARSEADAMSDSSLQALAHMALAFADHELAEIQASGGPDVSDDVDESFSDKLTYQIWQPGGVMGYRSLNAPRSPLTDGQEGFADTPVNGQSLRTYTAWNASKTFQVQMAALPGQRENYSARISLALVLGLLMALVIFYALMRRSIDLAFAPLRDTTEALGRKTAADLSPVSAAPHVAELAPVIDAFNDLMQRMSRSLRHEQRFTSDAAHELRTPLSALKVLVRNLRRARSDAERDEALGEMEQSIDRSTRLIEQLLALACIDGEPLQPCLHEALAPAELAHSVMHELQALADERHTSLTLTDRTPPGDRLSGNRQGLRAVLRNLVENALVHTPPGGQVRIEVWADATHIGWQVHDSGPGVPPDMRERVFARFFRLDRSASSGSGLGLSLVRRIVELHGGQVRLNTSTELGGACVTVTLPREPAAPQPSSTRKISRP